jgi:hypothetical protein
MMRLAVARLAMTGNLPDRNAPGTMHHGETGTHRSWFGLVRGLAALRIGDVMTKPPDREVLLEFQRVGSYMKATAMDAATLTEVSVVGPANHSQEMLRRTVLAKLDYVLAKNTGAKNTGKPPVR